MSHGRGLGEETLAGSSSFAAEAESLNPFKFLFIDCGFMAKPLAVETHELPPRKCISRQREPTRGLLQLPAGLQMGGFPGCAAPCSCTQVSPVGCNGLSPPHGQGDPWVLVAVSGKRALLAFWVPSQIPPGLHTPSGCGSLGWGKRAFCYRSPEHRICCSRGFSSQQSMEMWLSGKRV